MLDFMNDVLPYLRGLNSLTKYPSIETYHLMGDRGKLLSLVTSLGWEIEPRPDDTVYAHEKIDGTNVRIIVLPNGTFFIGSRDELLFFSEDILSNPAQHIVENTLGIAAEVATWLTYRPPLKYRSYGFFVVYGELYGGKIGANAKVYSTDPSQYGFRVFDVAIVDDWMERIKFPLDQIARWRDQGGQHFITVPELDTLCYALELNQSPLVWQGPMQNISTDLLGTAERIAGWSTDTKVGLTHVGHSEGVVIRTERRTWIRKLRHEDYQRTLKGR